MELFKRSRGLLIIVRAIFFIFLINIVLISSSYALSVSNHLITDDPKAGSGCATPTAKSTFTPDDSKVYFWVLVSNAMPLDTLTFKWVAPDNSLYASAPWTIGLAGSACGASSIQIKDHQAANKPGQWRAEIYNGTTLLTSDTFTIGAPQPPTCTYTFSAWGACQPDGTQTRTVVSSTPAGCTGAPLLSQTCTYVPPALSAPKNLKFTLNGEMLTIEWDAVAGATGYKAGLGTQSGKYSSPADLGNITKVGPVSVAGVPAGTYFIAVKAYNGNQESAFSNEIAVTIAPPPATLSAPQNLRFTLSGSMLTVEWDAVSGAAGYKLGIGVQTGTYSAPVDLGNITKVGPVSVAGAPAGTYYAAMQAFNNNKESAYSNEIAITIDPPKYELSADQKALIESSGNPDYLTILFNTDAQRREETWTYKNTNKMYVFWDGVSLGETDAAIDPNAYSNPPALDPSLFTKNTQVSNLVYLFGSNYSIVEDPGFSVPDFKTLYFPEKGLFAGFLNSNLANIVSTDIPSENTAALSIPGLLLSQDVNLSLCSDYGLSAFYEPTDIEIALFMTLNLLVEYCKEAGWTPDKALLKEVIQDCETQISVVVNDENKMCFEPNPTYDADICMIGIRIIDGACTDFLKSKEEKKQAGINVAIQAAEKSKIADDT